MRPIRVQQDLHHHLLLALEGAGIGAEALQAELRAEGISVSDTSSAVHGGAERIRVLEVATHLVGDPCLALRLGQMIGIASYGSFGFALMSCANLRESLQLLLRYGQVLFQPSWTVREYEGGLLLRANLTLRSVAQQQLVTELAFSNVAAVGRSLYGKQVERTEGVEVHLNYSRPAHAACYKKAINVPVTFDCEHSQLLLPSAILDTPVKTASRTEHVVFHQQCEEILRGLSSVEKTTADVRQCLIQSAGDFLDIAQVAESMHVSERTLRRRLAAESTTFRATAEEVRDLLAREYLIETELTVADIAHLLAYSETVNFRRAFVRWNGVTPGAYRKQHVTENDSIVFPVNA